MKRRLLRIENLLVIVPVWILCMSVYEALFTEESVLEQELKGSIIVFLFLFLCTYVIQWVFMLLPLYLIHYFLRIANRRNRIICFIHIIITVFILIFWYTAPDAVSIVPGWHTVVMPPMGLSFNLPVMAILFFWLVQVAFVWYGLRTIRRWRKQVA